MSTQPRSRRLLPVLTGVLGLSLFSVAGPAAGSTKGSHATPNAAPGQSISVEVAGTGVHHFTTAVVHQDATPASGFVQRSTDVVDLRGDLQGTLLYHVTTQVDPEAGTLTNTGEQWFSGTVLGSDPLVLHDDTFRFVVQLGPDGASTVGEVHLRRSADAPQTSVRACDLDVVGTGVTSEGDGTFSYTGTCIRVGG